MAEDPGTTNRIKLGILCGGPSPEHRISLLSSRNILAGASRERYDVVMLGVDTGGHWFLYEDGDHLVHPEDPHRIALRGSGRPVAPVRIKGRGCLLDLDAPDRCIDVDVIFPVMHGPYGEDGTVQGMLQAAGIPFVGCGVTATAVCMDKDHAKCILRSAGVPVVDWIAIQRGDLERLGRDEVLDQVGSLPVFVKPANMGSSVGISRVDRVEHLESALQAAFEYDTKVLLERTIKGRELECSVLGNESPKASGVGEIVVRGGFYSYEAKYLDDSAADLHLTADLDSATHEQVRGMAVQAFRALGCRGLARVDFFLDEAGVVLVNEVNTMPGFTRISMYPKLWERSGISMENLIDRLVELAV